MPGEDALYGRALAVTRVRAVSAAYPQRTGIHVEGDSFSAGSGVWLTPPSVFVAPFARITYTVSKSMDCKPRLVALRRQSADLTNLGGRGFASVSKEAERAQGAQGTRSRVGRRGRAGIGSCV